MAEASIAITAGSGTNLHTNTRTISATTMHDEYMLPGEYAIATYNVRAQNISIATANDHVLQIMAGSSLNVRIRRIHLEQSSNATTVALRPFDILRLTTAGTGGTAVTPAKYDTADSAAGATAMTLPSAKGTESTIVMSTVLVIRQGILATAAQPDDDFLWTQGANGKPIIIPAGTSNGIAIKILTATAAATVDVNVEIVETAYL